MYSIKLATIFQVVLLLLALGFSVLFYILSSIGKGMNHVEYIINIPTAYGFLTIFIILMIVLKLFVKSDYILSIGGIIVFIIFLMLHYFVYKSTGTIRLTKYDFIYAITLVLLLVNSVKYLTTAIKI